MNNRNKLIELLIYIAIVAVGVVLLLTGEPERAVENMDMGGTSYAAVLEKLGHQGYEKLCHGQVLPD